MSTRERAKTEILSLVWMQLWLHLSRECLFLAAEQMVPLGRAGSESRSRHGQGTAPASCGKHGLHRIHHQPVLQSEGGAFMDVQMVIILSQ